MEDGTGPNKFNVAEPFKAATTNEAGDFIWSKDNFPLVICTRSVTCTDGRKISASKMNDGGKKLVHNGLLIFRNLFVYGGGVMCVLIGGEVHGMEKCDVRDDRRARDRIMI